MLRVLLILDGSKQANSFLLVMGSSCASVMFSFWLGQLLWPPLKCNIWSAKLLKINLDNVVPHVQGLGLSFG